MKRAAILLVGLLGLLASGDTPRLTQPSGARIAGAQPKAVDRYVDRSAKDLTSTVHDLRATRSPVYPSAKRADLGNLWTDVAKLRRTGANTRAIEYYASDLEQGLRRGPQGAVATRHALNNLEHEATILRQRLGRQ
jgi:hypothetical protein